MLVRSTFVAFALGLVALACSAEAEETKPAESPVTAKDPTDASGGCCGGRAVCIPSAAVPESRKENLSKCEGADSYCVPKAFVADQDYKGKACKSSLTLGETKKAYDGVCLSDCLNIEGKQLLGKDGCEAGDLCVPCTHPITGEATTAPGCPGS